MKTKGLQNQQARNYFIDMLKALFYCHKVVKVIHRDIKPDNIMINHNQEAVLIDFGVSFSMMKDTEKDPTTANIQGSKLYFAPELLYDKEERNKIQINGEQTDLWALGITFYQILCGRTPFEDAKTEFHL